MMKKQNEITIDPELLKHCSVSASCRIDIITAQKIKNLGLTYGEGLKKGLDLLVNNQTHEEDEISFD
jgi:hypothetical protein